MSPNAASPALQAAAIFLTRPLILLGTQSPATVVSLQLFMQAALSSAGNSSQLLSFASTCLPPLPIQLACVAFGIKWTAWIRALGGAAFDLVIEPTRVYVVKKSTGQIGIIWISNDMDVAMSPSPSPLPNSLEADSESELDASDIEFDAPSSRPSSRSSIISDSAFSFSSRSSHSSKSSVSSTASLSKIPITKPTSTPAPAPKSQPTKYLYQGGVSTVLTGGVMLGGATRPPVVKNVTPVTMVAAAPAPRPAAIYTPPHRARGPGTSPCALKDRAPASSASASSWRRGPAPIRLAA